MNMKNFKAKINKKRLELTIVFLTFFLFALLKLLSATFSPVLAEESLGIPSLFYNDTHFPYSVPGSTTYLPLKQYNGVHYVPLDMLKLLNNIKMDSTDKYTDKFYIQYQNNNYIAFHISAERAYNQNAEYTNCKVYKYMGILYVPVEIIAKELGLEWEYRPEYNAGRIKEVGARRSFDDLLEKFIPKPKPPDTTTSPPSPPETAPPVSPPPETAPWPLFPPLIMTEPPLDYTTPPISEPTTADDIPQKEISSQQQTTTIEPTTAEPTTPESTEEIQNYLMFYDSFSPEDEAREDENTDKTAKINEILTALDENDNMKAIFFLSGEEIKKNPEILRSVYAFGHKVGIKFERGTPDDDVEALVAELEEVNALIYSVLKHKTKFCIFGDAKYIYDDKLISEGYYPCGFPADLADIENADEMIEFLKRERYNIFMFDINNADYKKYLEWFKLAANTKIYINFSYINNANIETIYKERGQ